MCNQGIERLKLSSSPSETLILTDNQHNGMDSSALPSDETPRVKFLCSFGGSIMPRPQDSKLRYVGGETRIVSVPRDINYEELMVRMRELYEGVMVLKYQQPDEDIDALVSVVNDDDVTNMMEEYDKIGSSDGFTRLRMFLFSNMDQDFSSSHFDSGEGDSERRYVDALNSLNDVSEFRKQQSPESPVMGQVVEPLLNPINIEFGLHNQQNCEVTFPQFNFPNLGSGQHQQSHNQRYNEMEAPWNPAYYSPRQHVHHDPRPMTEFPSSPSAFYRGVFGELPDKCSDRMPEEYVRQSVNHRPQYDHQLPFVDNVGWLPPGAISCDKVSIPGNAGHAQNGFEGNSVCEYCRMTFQRNQTSSEAVRYPDSRWKHGVQPHLEPPNVGNEFHQFANPCAECSRNRDTYIFNPDANLDHGVYSKEQNEPPSFYTEAHNHERGWVLHHQLNHRVEEPRVHMSGAGMMNEHYRVDGTGANFHLAHGDGSHQVPSNYISNEDTRYVRVGHEMGNEGFRDQAVGAGPHIHIPALEDRGVRYGNFPAAYGTDNLYQVSHGHTPAPALWIKVQNPLRATPSYEALNILPQTNGTSNLGIPRGMQEGSPSFHVGLDNPNHWAGPSQKVFGIDGSAAPECLHGCAPKFNSDTLGQDNRHSFAPDPVRSPPDMLHFSIPVESVPQVPSSSSMIDDKIHASTTSVYSAGATDGMDANGAVGLEGKSMFGEGHEEKCIETVEDPDMPSSFLPDKNKVDKKSKEAGFESYGLRPTKEGGDTVKPGETNRYSTFEHEGLSVKRLSFLPELIASVKKAALEGAEEMKARVQGNVDGYVDTKSKEAAFHDVESVNAHADLEVDSDSDHPTISKIEPTEAEAEALARGLQTIKNDDLEEIRELGSGTYGAVYHGKWKGSDVAIKRIKASCFAGKPSERERLIADLWKEALILSSLHHPNIVSFYGIVRDGPDGSLATVAEFMVNGSLKQFLQKKDRTIDRRKRLIIAMDTAFGMEYLHGKNIVHFDLKCENLLVNMRDPHRPVCKIGDLGLSKVKQQTLVSGGVRGTLPWMAPELLSGKSNMVTEKIDVYSFGIVMWELLTGEDPYADMRGHSIIGGIVSNSLRPQVPCWCDPEWKSLMENCWASDPAERPSFSEISQKLRKMSAAINLK